MRISSKMDGYPIYDGDNHHTHVKAWLNANESFVPPHPRIQRGLDAAYQKTDLSRYPDIGADALCTAFANFYDIERRFVVAGNGSDELISLLVHALLPLADTVLLTNPDFSMYAHAVHMARGKVEIFEKDAATYELDIDALIAKAQAVDAAMIIFSNPCNPTGSIVTRAEIERLLETFDGLVVVDEAYMDFADESVLDMAGKVENLVVLRTASKALALAGLRIGFSVSTESIKKRLMAAKSPYNVGTLAQALGAAALTEKEAYQGAIQAITASRDVLYESLKALSALFPQVITKVYPTYANFVYFKAKSAKKIYRALLKEGVLIRCFDDETLRVTAGEVEANLAFIKALNQYIQGDGTGD